jgi:hypothetical protein
VNRDGSRLNFSWISAQPTVHAAAWHHDERMISRGDRTQEAFMSFAIIEIIMHQLGMAGFGLQATPKAPTVEQALQYAIADADLAVRIDAASMVPGAKPRSGSPPVARPPVARPPVAQPPAKQP